MRIRGSGSGFGFFGFGGGGDNRSDSFKKGRKPGQKVRGKLLKWVSDDMAWVEIEGHKLLAQLKSKPPVGAQLTFLIKQLYPEIMLKEIFGASAGGTNTLSLASDFESARTLFENALRPLSQSVEREPHTQRLTTFIELISSNNKLLTTFLDTTACVQTINRHINTAKVGTLYYQPWLLPAGRRHITLLRLNSAQKNASSLTESIVEFELGKLGMVRTEFLYKSPVTGYRLKLQYMDKADELKRYLNTRKHPDLIGEMECLGITKLPQSGHGGILAQTIFKQ